MIQARTRPSLRIPRRAAGFTLLELMLVIGLLVLLTALVWPALQQWTVSAQLPESAENLRSTLRMARASACMTGRRVRLRWKVKEQQPVIEYEVDPTEKPGAWEPCPDNWVEGNVLLGDVQVAEVRSGRPDIMTPVSHSQGLSERELFEQEVVVSEDEAARSDEEKQRELGGLGGDFETKEEEESDPARPTIVFEVDGSSDWFTLIVARGEPGEPLDPKTRQTWIILDGRTGLPRIHEPLTEEQEQDLALRPDLDKLQPPETDTKDLTLTAGLDLGSVLGGGGQEGLGLDGGMEAAAGLGSGALDPSQAAGAVEDALGSAGAGAGDGMGGLGAEAGAGAAEGDQPQQADQDENTSGSRRSGGRRGTRGADGGSGGQK